MSGFRELIAKLGSCGELLSIDKPVDPRYELGALLKQAEARRKAVLFRDVSGSDFPVVAGLLTSPQRFASSLGLDDAAEFTTAAHAELLAAAIAKPMSCEETANAHCKEITLIDAEANVSVLPVPTFFVGDSGPYLTAAVGIARNPDNDILNAGYYRVLVMAGGTLAVSVSPGSGLHRFIQAAGEANETLNVALVIGADPSLLMSAAAKVPADISELDVAGALQGSPLKTVRAERSDLQVPAQAEFVVEVELDPANVIDNTMGEFGDMYGTQKAFVSQVKAITHRRDAMFHAIRAGAGKEHNTIGTIVLYGVEPELRLNLQAAFPDVVDIRLIFDPPSMGNRGDLYVAMKGGRRVDAESIYQHIYAAVCGAFPLLRIVRRIVLLDEDLELASSQQLNWAVATRAHSSDDYQMLSEGEEAVRMGIDTRVAGKSGMERLVIPGEAEINLDDYL